MSFISGPLNPSIRRRFSLLLAGLAGSVLASTALVGCADMITTTTDTFNHGMAQYNEGNYTEAAGTFRNTARQNPRSYQAYYMMGNCYEQLGEHHQAVQVYRTSLEVQTVTLEGQYDTAQRTKTLTALAGAIAKSDQRETEINAVINKAQSSQSAEDYFLLARIYEFRGDADSAIEAYDHATILSPQNFDVLKEYGLYLEKLGQTQRAEAPLRRAYALNSNDVQVTEALRRLGIVPGPSIKRQSELNKPPLPKGPIPEIEFKRKGSSNPPTDNPSRAPEGTSAPRD